MAVNPFGLSALGGGGGQAGEAGGLRGGRLGGGVGLIHGGEWMV